MVDAVISGFSYLLGPVDGLAQLACDFAAETVLYRCQRRTVYTTMTIGEIWRLVALTCVVAICPFSAAAAQLYRGMRRFRRMATCLWSLYTWMKSARCNSNSCSVRHTSAFTKQADGNKMANEFVWGWSQRRGNAWQNCPNVLVQYFSLWHI